MPMKITNEERATPFASSILGFPILSESVFVGSGCLALDGVLVQESSFSDRAYNIGRCSQFPILSGKYLAVVSINSF